MEELIKILQEELKTEKIMELPDPDKAYIISELVRLTNYKKKKTEWLKEKTNKKRI